MFYIPEFRDSLLRKRVFLAITIFRIFVLAIVNNIRIQKTQMEFYSILKKLQLTKPSSILKKVIRHNCLAIENNQKKLIAIHANTSLGTIITGSPIKLDDDGNSIFISETGALTYCQISTLSYIQIIKPETIWDLLTDGSYFNIPIENIPTAFQLKKNWAELQESFKNSYAFVLHEKVLENNELSDKDKYQMQQLAQILKHVFSSIAKDTIGLETLQLLDSVSIENNDTDLAVVLENDSKLIIQINLDKKLDIDITETLQKLIEAKF